MGEDTEKINLSDHQVLRVVSSSPDELELESTWSPGATKAPPAHWHPHQREHFEILAGNVTIEIEGQAPRVLGPGEVLHIPPRTVHRMWNAGAESARASWSVTPRLRTEEMFRKIGLGLSPMRTVWALWTYRNEMRIARRPAR